MQKEEIQDTHKRTEILLDLCLKMLQDYKAEASEAFTIAMNIIRNIAIFKGITREQWNLVNENFIEMIFGEDQ